LAVEAEENCAFHSYAVLVLSLFERAETEWFWRLKRDWMSDYAGRIGDLRKALSWTFGATGDPELGIRLTAAAIPLWDELSSIGEARARVDDALTAIEEMDGCAPDLAMKLATARAWSMTFALPILAETETAWRDALRFASDAGSVEYELRGYWGFAVYLMYTGRPNESIVQLE
jgi:hypothetical protein